MQEKTYSRIYVCHTFYHVYISFLKEFALPKSEWGKASLVLSSLSTNFGQLKDRIEKLNFFEEVFSFDEKRDTFFPELAKYRKNYHNPVKNMISRILFTCKFAKLQSQFVTVDYKKYKDIYVFCDVDPIGIYLSRNRIKFHGVEDGFNCLHDAAEAYLDNQSNFSLKKFFSEKLNLIYVQNGFNKYCISMEVNCIADISLPCKKYIEVPRSELMKNLNTETKQILIKAFVDDPDALDAIISKIDQSKKNIIILTEDLCDFDTRCRIIRDLVTRYEKEGTVFIKPHPRDLYDYSVAFSDVNIFSPKIPMEIFNLLPELHFSKVVAVFTPLEHVFFADEKEKLGSAFMDNYEPHEKHERFTF